MSLEYKEHTHKTENTIHRVHHIYDSRINESW